MRRANLWVHSSKLNPCWVKGLSNNNLNRTTKGFMWFMERLVTMLMMMMMFLKGTSSPLLAPARLTGYMLMKGLMKLV